MIIEEPFRCERCNNVKGAANHWFIGMVVGKTHGSVVEICAWDAKTARKKYSRHLCGIRCATAFVQEELGKMVGGTVQKATASPSAATFPPSPNEAAELEAIQKAGFDRAQSVPRLDVDIGDPNAPDEGWEGFGGKVKL